MITAKEVQTIMKNAMENEFALKKATALKICDEIGKEIVGNNSSVTLAVLVSADVYLAPLLCSSDLLGGKPYRKRYIRRRLVGKYYRLGFLFFTEQGRYLFLYFLKKRHTLSLLPTAKALSGRYVIRLPLGALSREPYPALCRHHKTSGDCLCQKSRPTLLI